MLLLSKAVSQLILPPGGLILLGITGLVYWQKRWGRMLVAISFALFWLLATEPVRDGLTSSLEFQYSALNITQIQNDAAAIVLLGGGIHENSPDYQGREILPPPSMVRTIYAAKIAKESPFEIYTTGGTPLAQNEVESEASVMKRWLIWFGVDANRIHTEANANTTWENAVFTEKLLSAQGINTIILVTSALHMPRSVWCFEQQNLQVIPAPTDYLTNQAPYDLRSFLPRWNVFSDSGDALHEYLGSFWYRLRYS